MKIVKGLKYSKEHEWIEVDGDKAYVGITDYAQNSLGDIVFVELPEVGDEMEIGDAIGVVESIKAASDIYSPISGTILEVNEELEDSPEKINQDPYQNWLVAIELKDSEELEELLDSKEYEQFCDEEE